MFFAHGRLGGGSINKSSFFLVNADVLPEVYAKVIEVKKLLACGEEKSSAAACKKVGISRSAFYKYRQCVYTYEEKLTQRIISYNAVLKDEPGVLSSVLSELHKHGANILTVNQNIPIDGVASVNVTVRVINNEIDPNDIKDCLKSLYGVVSAKFISGE